MRIFYEGILTVGFPMLLMHGFSHIYNAHFLRWHYRGGFAHAFNARFFPHILCAFFFTYKMRISYHVIPTMR